MINKEMVMRKETEPYNYAVIDNFFEEDFYEILEKDYPEVKDFEKKENQVKRMDGDITYGDETYNNLIEASKTFRRLHEWVYSEDFIHYFTKLFYHELKKLKEAEELTKDIEELEYNNDKIEKGGVVGINELKEGKNILYSRLDIGYGGKGYGVNNGGAGPHVDNPQRLISILAYVGGYESILGGNFRIYKRTKNNLELHESLQPQRNRVIASIQTNNAYHDAEPVIDIIGKRNAMYIAISSGSKLWKDCERSRFNKQFNKNRYRLNKFELLRKKINDRIKTK